MFLKSKKKFKKPRTLNQLRADHSPHGANKIKALDLLENSLLMKHKPIVGDIINFLGCMHLKKRFEGIDWLDESEEQNIKK